ncbi:MAG: ATP-binding cassette domain-containing protein [Acidimicrobiia bacterium]|nr:ATP-binding cassette domain-containing protein [Acidimicrobiia bacterium]
MTSSSTNLVSIEDLHVWRGEAHILHGVSFDVPKGQVTALLGRNGVGKTTTLLALLGLLPATGSAAMGDAELVNQPTHENARRGIGYVPEDREVFSGLTVKENLRLAERPGVKHRYDLVYELFPDLAQRPNQEAGTLSGGQQQMLALGRVLLNPNELLLVDEPTKGLAPIIVEGVVQALHKATAESTVLLVEQNLAVATELATDAVVLDQGRVVFTGTMAGLVADPALTGRHLGVEVR